MSYKILKQQIAAAKKLGVTIKPSTVQGKKIAVYKNGEKVADAVKEFTPDSIDGLIDQGTQFARMVKPLKDLFGSMFKRKKR